MALKLRLYQWCGLLLALAMPILADVDCSKTPELISNEKLEDNCCTTAKDIETEVKKKCKEQPDHFCEMDCIFNETKIVENGEINHGHLEAFLKEDLQNDAELIPIVTQAFEKCVPLVKKKYEADHQESETCNKMAFMIIDCTTMQVFAHCPANRWKTSPACEEAKTYIEHCPFDSQ